MSVNSGSKSHSGGPLQKRRATLKPTQPEKKIAEDEFMASAIGDVEWLRQSLRGKGGAINFDKNGLAPIHLASIHGRLDCLKLLVEKFKVDVNLPSATGWRPVHLAISNQTGKRSFTCLQYLITHGADPSAVNDDGITPMHQAASEGHVQCLKALVEVGAVLDGMDHRGHRPIDLAKLWGHRKCARILATEQWHQDKEFLSNELVQLQKVKMHQVMQEIEADEELKAEQQFYGDIAFKQWLETRGLPMEKTGPSSQSKDTQSVGSSVSGRKSKRGKTDSSTESLFKANSKQSKTSSTESKKIGPSPIAEELHSPKRPPPPGLQQSNTSLSRVTYPSTESEQEAQQPIQDEIADKDESKYYNLDEWNKSTKLPKARSPYVPLLPDHYPRDVYTMKPKFPPKRCGRSATLITAEKKAGATIVKEDHLKPRMPNLPPDIINKTLEPEKYERPVVYKCKHIHDVHNKKHFDTDELPRDETGFHLSSDPNSRLFKVALLPERAPRTASTVISGISDWNYGNRENMALPQMMKMMARTNQPTHFPATKGKEYDLNYGQLAGI